MTDSTPTATTPLKQAVGKYGIWNVGLRGEDLEHRGERAESAAELEELGFGTLWVGGSGSARNAVPLIEATSKVVVGTSVQNIWEHDAMAAAASFTAVEAAHPGRFVLGLGVGHAKVVEGYHHPYATLTAYLDTLGKAGVPGRGVMIAALGPRMLKLAADRTAGSIPYLVTPEHTAQARGILGADALLAPELKVILDPDPSDARSLARQNLAPYLGFENYTNNWLRHGFTEDDLTGGGSDRLIDALFAWGDESRIRNQIDTFLSAGADHVALQVVTPEGPTALPREEWRRLAALLR